MNMKLVMIVFVLLAVPASSAWAACEEWSRTSIQWRASTNPHYTICYTSASSVDVNFVRRYLNKTVRLARDKYEFTRMGRAVNVFLFPAPSTYARVGTATNLCCFRRGGVAWAEIHYLAPSAREWHRYPTLGGLQYPHSDFHAKVLMHEYLNLVLVKIHQWNTPSWVPEGLSEYEGFHHTTLYNRTQAADDLIRYVHEGRRDQIFCCLTLQNRIPVINTSDVYYGGAVIMEFLAQFFDEKIHLELLRNKRNNFPLTFQDALRRRGYTVQATWRALRAWLNTQYAIVDG